MSKHPENNFNDSPSYFYEEEQRIAIESVTVKTPPRALQQGNKVTDRDRRSWWYILRKSQAELYKTDNGELVMFSTFTLHCVEDKFPEVFAETVPEELLASMTVQKLCFAKNLFLVTTPAPKIAVNIANYLWENFKNVLEILYLRPSYSINEWSLRFRQNGPSVFDSSKWYLKRLGLDGIRGMSGASPTIAIIDQGFYSKVELRGKSFINAKVSGFYSPNCVFVPGIASIPEHHHGKAVADLVREACPQSELVLIALDSELALGQPHTLALAIAYASTFSCHVDHEERSGVDIIICAQQDKLSLYGPVKYLVSLAVDYALVAGRKGVGTPVFWSGEDDINTGIISSHQGIAAVGAVGYNAKLYYDQCTSPPDFLAPGKNINLGSATIKGTSFAAPLAAGLAAGILSNYPDLNHLELRAILRLSCVKSQDFVYDNGRNDQTGYGLLNYPAALELAGQYDRKERPYVDRVKVMVCQIQADLDANRQPT